MKVPYQAAVVSLSGGMDSCTVLAYAIQKFGVDNVYAVGFDYGQKHRKELAQASKIAGYFGVSFEIIQLPKIFAGAGSTLVDADHPVEALGSYEEIADRFGSQPTVVPNRNMNFLAMSVTYALTHGAGYVMLGSHAGDSASWHYPDCHPSFTGAMQAATQIATEGEIEIVAPFNHLSKGAIVRRAAELGAPLQLTLSCYNGARPACGVCSTCLERIEAFREAGIIDPIAYEREVDFGDYAQSWEQASRSHRF